jgi:putative Ig domain-containing protein
MIAGKERTARRGLTRAGLMVVLCALLAVPATANASTVSPFAQGHPYRHGVVPTRAALAANPSIATSGGNLAFGGGISGVGVTDGPPKVYLVFFGSQWGTQGVNSAGNVTFSGDPKGFAPDVEAFIKGLGTGGELWSGVMTQYCQGVSTGATSCPSSSTFHVGYPTGGAFAGVWADEALASPTAATAHRLVTEANRAASHFGNTTAALNRNVQYVIISPHGTNPDNYKTSGFCAWHDYTGDPSLAITSPDGLLAFTNLPYLTDVGTSCGMNFVNSGTAGTLDGVTIVEGHEYAETISDQFPAGGWTDSVGNENGDKCAWIRSGQGASQNITLTTGTFAVQSTWANDFNGGAGGCEVSHPIVSNTGGNTVSVTNPGGQTSTVGTAVSLQIQASDSASGQTLTYSATGLPAGLSINSSTGLISGTPTTAGSSSVTVTATDTTGAFGNTSFSWTVNPTGGCTASQLLGNPGFETGTAAPWTGASGIVSASSTSEPSHSGGFDAWFGQVIGSAGLGQAVTLPTGCSTYTFSFWLHIDTASTSTSQTATLTAKVLSSSGTLLKTLAVYNNLQAASGYQQYSFDVSAFAGQTVTLKFLAVEPTSGGLTNFVVDDTAMNVS